MPSSMMKRHQVVASCFVAVALAACGVVAHAAGPKPSFPVKISENRRHLVDQRGVPFLYHADTPWLLFYRPTLAEVDQYLTDRQAKGFTALQVHLFAFEATYANPDGEFPLHDLNDLATVNSRFLDHAEEIVSRAAERGLLVSIAPIWLGCTEDGWRHIMKSNGVEKCRDLGRVIGRRFMQHLNVMWILGGDKDPGEWRPHVRAVAEGIREFAPHQLMTAHPGSPRSAAEEYGEERWLDVNCTYSYSPDITSVGRPQFHVYAAAMADWQRQPVRPFILLESAYENMRNATAQVIRRQAYWACFSGACGHALGNFPIYRMDPGWQAAMDQPGSRDMAHLASLFRVLPWHRLAPDAKHEWLVAGYGTFDGAASKDEKHAKGFDYVTAAFAPQGDCLAAYLPQGNRVTVDLGKFGGPVRARWFDPSAGAWSAAAPRPLRNSGRQEFTPPGKTADGFQDWVLVLRTDKKRESTTTGIREPDCGPLFSSPLTCGEGTLAAAVPAVSPTTTPPGAEPPQDARQLARLHTKSLFDRRPDRFALSPTADGFPDVDTYRDLEFYLESEPVSQTRWLPDPKPRLFVLTDISNEPDDEESMVRLLVYANEFDFEGLVATTSTWLRQGTRVDLIQRQLDAYAQARQNLLKHAPGFPPAESLRAVTAAGQPAYGMAAVGEGKTTAGSQRLLAAADRADERPLWVAVWGGANTLAQALWDARRQRSPTAMNSLVAKLRVYGISDQDDAGQWLRREFPDLFYIVSPSTTDWKEYWRATWTGISGDRHYRNGPRHKFHLVDNPWLEENIIRNHGPLGALYPRLEYIMEGDTPSFLGLINNGLGWHASPAYGGWGGRYDLYQPYGETRPIWTNNQDSRDTVTADNGQTQCSDMATIWRWREHFQHDFAARMDWCVADEFKKANHNPMAVLNGDATRRVLEIAAKPGDAVTLSAQGTRDPDDDAFEVRWWIYPETSSLRDAKGQDFPKEVALTANNGLTTTLVAPAVKKPATIHVILEVQDRGTPALVAYRRAVIGVRP